MDKIDIMYSASHGIQFEDSILARLKSLIHHAQFIQGPEVREFESLASKYADTKNAIGCANGTDALTVALMAIDLQANDVVFTPSFTYVATAEAISILRGIPYFVDIDPISYNISPTHLEESIKDAISKGYNTKAIILVDLFGNPADYDAIKSIAKKYRLTLISDAAQSFGSMYKGVKAASIADITTTSFFPTKPLGCYGDGGMIFTNDDELAHKIRSICFHGKGEDKYHHVRIGMNSRLDSVQAIVLSEKITVFEQDLAKRNSVSDYYNFRLSNYIPTPKIEQSDRSSWAVYNLRHKNRDVIIKELADRGVPSNVYYRTPLHMQPAYKDSYKANSLTNSEQASEEVFCLPMHSMISDEQAKFIIDNLLYV
ncbi:MAG: DegT/DnrJ/EryC1/StrS family aminotransferase, partial [Alphaproteobacteria bacterium]